MQVSEELRKKIRCFCVMKKIRVRDFIPYIIESNAEFSAFKVDLAEETPPEEDSKPQEEEKPSEVEETPPEEVVTQDGKDLPQEEEKRED